MSTATLLPLPNFVVYNQLGDPAAGALIHTYEVGTTTPRLTWQDAAETIPNANPIVCSADGACLLYGSGDYTLVTTDSGGNLIPAYCGLSQDLSTLLAVEVARATAAEAALASEDLTLQANITAEAAARAAADTALAASIAAETARAEAAEAVLQGQITAGAGGIVKGGGGMTDAGGTAAVTFAVPFPNGIDAVVASSSYGTGGWWVAAYDLTLNGFNVTTSSPNVGGNWLGGPQGFFWIAFGS